MVTIKQEPISKQFIASLLPKNALILEAGAHIGRDTVKMSKLWPEGTIYAFEPVPELYHQLIENTKHYPNIVCYPYALSDANECRKLYVSGGASTAASSVLEPLEYRKKRPEVTFHEIIVETITIDEWATNNKIDHIDFMWLDMQGHELTVLNASPRILSTTKVILLEVSLTQRFKNNPLYHEAIDFMHKRGFEPIQEDLPKHDKINILFKRKNE